MIEKTSDERSTNATNPLFPAGFLKVVGFLIPADETTQELIDWYENIHSRNASVLWPHMDLYRRNYILDVERGPEPTYRVVTEFVWKSESDKKAAAAIFQTPAASTMLNEKFPAWLKPLDIPNTHGLVAVEPVEIRHPAMRVRHDAAVRRRIILLEQGPSVTRAGFESAAKSWCRTISETRNVNVSLESCRHSGPWPTTGAVVYVDDLAEQALPPVVQGTLTIANVFRVRTAWSPL